MEKINTSRLHFSSSDFTVFLWICLFPYLHSNGGGLRRQWSCLLSALLQWNYPRLFLEEGTCPSLMSKNNIKVNIWRLKLNLLGRNNFILVFDLHLHHSKNHSWVRNALTYVVITILVMNKVENHHCHISSLYHISW